VVIRHVDEVGSVNVADHPVLLVSTVNIDTSCVLYFLINPENLSLDMLSAAVNSKMQDTKAKFYRDSDLESFFFRTEVYNLIIDSCP
jgi:hypothetical protein